MAFYHATPKNDFTVVRSTYGFQVVDITTGHPVTDTLSYAEAESEREMLNESAGYGPQGIEEALCCA